MADLKNITAQVKEILEKDKDARNSDNLLYLRVYEALLYEADRKSTPGKRDGDAP